MQFLSRNAGILLYYLYMKKNYWIIAAGIVLVVVGNGVYAYVNNKDQTIPSEMVGMIKDEQNLIDSASESGDNLTEAGTYEAYSPEKIARAETGDVVLFFHASWCPSCRGLNADIEKNAGAISPGVSILKVDYDKETELKKKYGVTYQHTLVQVDGEGNLMKKWSGSPSLQRLESEIE